MGGLGSGRHWCIASKNVTSDLKSIDIRLWHREGLLSPGQSFNWKWSYDGEPIGSIQVLTESERVQLKYSYCSFNQEWGHEYYPVHLNWTSCNFGGERPWFLCPASGCGHRVAVLYGGNVFACRHCHDLAYQSQRESIDNRALRRANKIRDRLEWEPGVLNGKGPKPKGMHWSTFQRLISEYDDNINQSLSRFTSYF